MVESKGPIFVVGAPRTGTTMTREILNMHPDVYLCNEVHFCERVFDVISEEQPLDRAGLERAVGLVEAYPWRYHGENPLRAREELIERARARGSRLVDLFAELMFSEAAHHGKSVVGDSSPQDVLYLETLHRWFPQARFVGLVRDPRAFLASYKNYYRKQITTYRNRYDPLSNALLWRSYMNAMLSASQSPVATALLLLRYEDLVREPDRSLRRICDHVGIDLEPGMLEIQRQNSSYFRQAEDDRARGISTDSLDRWRSSLDAGEIWLVERVAGGLMGELRYEKLQPSLGAREIGQLTRAAARAPARVYNLLFRTGKPFTLRKLRRTLSRLSR